MRGYQIGQFNLDIVWKGTYYTFQGLAGAELDWGGAMFQNVYDSNGRNMIREEINRTAQHTVTINFSTTTNDIRNSDFQVVADQILREQRDKGNFSGELKLIGVSKDGVQELFVLNGATLQEAVAQGSFDDTSTSKISAIFVGKLSGIGFGE